MPELKGTQTHQNLKDAFAGESQANRRYLYYAKQADVEGYPEIASNFRETAEGETGHAHGHLDYIKQVGDPANDWNGEYAGYVRIFHWDGTTRGGRRRNPLGRTAKY